MVRKLDSYLEQIRAAGVQGLMGSGTEHAQELLGLACTMFEQYDRADQHITIAMILGMILAAVEGETSEWEMERGELLTYRERLEIFQVQVEVVYSEAMAMREHPDCPPGPKQTVN